MFTELSETYEKFRHIDQKTFMTMDEVVTLSHDLAAIISQQSASAGDIIVGIANGALLPSKIVATDLHIPLHIVQVRRSGSRMKQWLFAIKDHLHIPNTVLLLGPVMFVLRRLQQRFSNLEETTSSFDFDAAGKTVILVDDAVHTGRTIRYVEQELLKRGAAEVRTAVICWYKGDDDSGDWGPDHFLHRQDQFYPWSNNSPHLKAFHEWLPKNGLRFWS